MSAVPDLSAPEPLPARSPPWKAPNVSITPTAPLLGDSGYYCPPRSPDLVLGNIKRYPAGKPRGNRGRPEPGTGQPASLILAGYLSGISVMEDPSSCRS